MNLKQMLGVALLTTLMITATGCSTTAHPSAGTVDAKADELLRQMSRTLAASGRFSFSAHSLTDQTLDSGQTVQVGRILKVVARRPDGILASGSGDVDGFQFCYDGTCLSLYNSTSNSIASITAPPTISQTLDMLADKYTMTIPLADMLLDDPYTALRPQILSARYLGLGYVFDKACHHLAFRQKNVDWELWLEDDARALPRKVVITHVTLPKQPRYTAFLWDWNLSADVPDSKFALMVVGAKTVEFAPAAQR